MIITKEDIVSSLQKMSQWIWVTDLDLERNKLSRVAAEEIIKLRNDKKQLIGLILSMKEDDDWIFEKNNGEVILEYFGNGETSETES